MPNLSIKDVPEVLAQQLRERAARHHRSLQGELMAIVEAAVGEGSSAPTSRQATEPVTTSYGAHEPESGDPANRRSSADRKARAARLQEIAASPDASFHAAGRLTREEANDRALLRRLGI